MADNIRALSRGLCVLEFLNKTGGATVQDTAAHLGFSRPTIHRLLGTLEKSGLIALGTDGTYRPTIAARALKEGLTEDVWALWAAEPILLELQREVVWTCEITTFDIGTCAMLKRDTTSALNPFHVRQEHSEDRYHSMLTSACGLAYLAFCPLQQQTQILRHLGRFDVQADTHTGMARIHGIIEKIRRDGYAVEQPTSRQQNLAVAAPICHEDRVVACISIIWMPSAVKLQDGLARFVPALKRAQAVVEGKLACDADNNADFASAASRRGHGEQAHSAGSTDG